MNGTASVGGLVLLDFVGSIRICQYYRLSIDFFVLFHSDQDGIGDEQSSRIYTCIKQKTASITT